MHCSHVFSKDKQKLWYGKVKDKNSFRRKMFKDLASLPKIFQTMKFCTTEVRHANHQGNWEFWIAQGLLYSYMCISYCWEGKWSLAVKDCIKFHKIYWAQAGCVQSWKTWKSHGIFFSFFRPGKVMEFDSRFWKSHGNYKKSSCGTAHINTDIWICPAWKYK